MSGRASGRSRAQAEADIINALPQAKPLPARAGALSGSLLASPIAAKFHPASWSTGERVLRGWIIG